MLVFPPRPKFSLKWDIRQQYMPNSWIPWIENAIVWSLAQEKRYRDMWIELSVIGLNRSQMESMNKKFETFNHEKNVENTSIANMSHNQAFKSYDPAIKVLNMHVGHDFFTKPNHHKTHVDSKKNMLNASQNIVNNEQNRHDIVNNSNQQAKGSDDSDKNAFINNDNIAYNTNRQMDLKNSVSEPSDRSKDAIAASADEYLLNGQKNTDMRDSLDVFDSQNFMNAKGDLKYYTNTQVENIFEQRQNKNFAYRSKDAIAASADEYLSNGQKNTKSHDRIEAMNHFIDGNKLNMKQNLYHKNIQADLNDKFMKVKPAYLFNVDQVMIIEKQDMPIMDKRLSRRNGLFLGKIFCSSAMLYDQWAKKNVANKNNIFNFILEEFITATVCLLSIPEREKLSIRRNILSKFGIYN